MRQRVRHVQPVGTVEQAGLADHAVVPGVEQAAEILGTAERPADRGVEVRIARHQYAVAPIQRERPVAGEREPGEEPLKVVEYDRVGHEADQPAIGGFEPAAAIGDPLAGHIAAHRLADERR